MRTKSSAELDLEWRAGIGTSRGRNFSVWIASAKEEGFSPPPPRREANRSEPLKLQVCVYL